jgi:hypothetical protein
MRSLKVINKIIISGIIYMVLYTIYMVFAPSIVDLPNFWRSYYYILMFSFPFSVFLIIYPLAEAIIQKLFMLVILTFLFLLISYNIALINSDILEWNRACISKVFGFIFAGVAALLIATALLINKHK